MKIMKHHILYNTDTGDIVHIHGGFDAATETAIALTKREALETLADFLPEPTKVDLLSIDTREPIDFAGMRVNLKEKCLEPIPIDKEER